MFHYPYETGRITIDLIFHDTIWKYLNCRIILSHARETLPDLLYRAAVLLPYTPEILNKSTDDKVEEAHLF